MNSYINACNYRIKTIHTELINNNKILDNTTLTSVDGCPKYVFWRGVEVWGTTNQHQFTIGNTCYQGTIELVNGASIENSEEGISNWKFNDWNSIGGIIHVSNSSFINNRRAISFMSYNNFNPTNPTQILPYDAYFYNTQFETSKTLPNSQPFYAFVTMWKVIGVAFKGCTFNNSNPDATYLDNLGMGIYAIDAAFSMDEYCNSTLTPCPTGYLQKSHFTRLKYGVEADKVETNNTYSIKNTIFTNCFYGVFNSGVNTSVIANNKFEYTPNYTPITQGLGVYFNTGTGYTIEGNEFVSSIPSPFVTIGTYMVNTGANNNQIYRNTITNFTYGLEAVGNNRNNDGSTGLRFFCNTFSGGKTSDIYVKTGGYYTNPGVALNQGIITPSAISAGNKFLSGNPPSYNIYNGSTISMNYYACQTVSVEIPFYRYGSIAVITKNVASNNCPIYTGGGNNSMMASFSNLENTFYSEKSIESTLNLQLKTLIDGGNTEALIQTVENSWPNETWQLRSELLNKSPYLSEDVLIESREKTQVLPNPVLFEIYKANPDALNKDEMIDVLLEKSNPMSEWMVDSLKSIREIETYRSQIEGSIGYHATQKDQAGFAIVNQILNDTSGLNNPLLQYWLEQLASFKTDIMLISNYCQTGNYLSAKELLDLLPVKYKLEGDALKEYETFSELYTDLKGFHDTGKTIFRLDSIDLVPIIDIADNGVGVGQVYAQNICHIYGYSYDPIIDNEEGDLQNKSHKIIVPENAITDENMEYVKVYPTPAKEWVDIKWKILSNDVITDFTVTNSIGVSQLSVPLETLEGEKMIDTREWNAGIYYYKAIQGGKTIQTGKIVISK
ncbi:MAG: T9SS type A sorting domain-containing protein [Bacteroidota bacterium]